MNQAAVDTEDKLKAIAESASEKKAFDIVALKVGEKSSIADYFFICEGQNPRQTKTIAESISDRLVEMKVKPRHVEGMTSGTWILMDYGDIIVHVFISQSREFYDLERLWGDCKRLELSDLVEEAV
ncbi:MAG TPA: ribosome silencing factor [Acidobacteriota bacterium]|nr:ribosome silencing factor [Acidobacteriota bacterium]